tara:strand:+ start:892 stop:2067 length:1176 start_codon:yes stop_codon:yes gene_type:complete
MAQHDYDIANQSGANFRADLNNALDAIVSNNSGTNEPSTKFAYEWWVDTTNDLLKIRNSANNAWITLPLSITADNATSGALTVNGNLTTTGSVDINGQELILDADADTSITADTDDQIDFRIGAVDVATLTNSHLVLKGTTPKITIGDGGEEDTALIFDGNAQDFYIGLDDSADDLIIGKGSTVGTTPAISIDENLLATFAGTAVMQDKLGINTSSPSARIEVQEGTASTYTALIQHIGNPNSGPPQVLKLGFQHTPNNGTSEFLRCTDTLNGTPVGRAIIMSNGGLANFQGNNANLSDEREKKNITDADNQLDNIKSLSVKAFHYNEDADSDDKRLGIIAQDIESSFPNLITDFNKSDEEVRKGVKEQQIMWMAIKAIQELEERVKTLEG